MMPPAVEGSGGDKTTFTAACRLVLDFGLSPEAALPLLLEYNTQCVPPWSEQELIRKLAAADSRPGPRGKLLAGEAPTSPDLSAGSTSASIRATAPIALSQTRDVGMIDWFMAGLFAFLGRRRGLFNDTRGYRPFQPPVKAISTTLAVYAMQCRQSLEGRELLWTDEKGRRWALRSIISGADGSNLICAGVAICLPQVEPAGSGSGATPEVRGELLQGATRDLKIHRGAAALLYYLHNQVLMQRTNRVRTTDRELGEVLFGHRTEWPRNWRRDLATTLDSLHVLNRADIIVGDDLRITFISNPLLDRIVESRGRCHEGCVLSGLGARHRHYTITIGEGFLGSLSGFVVETDEEGETRFNFNPDRQETIDLAEEAVKARYARSNQILDPQDRLRRDKEMSSKLRAARAKALEQHKARFQGIITIAFVPLVFGHQLRLQGNMLPLINGIMREITRDTRSRAASRSDRAKVFRGNLVPGSRRNSTILLPALNPNGEYVECNGNGTSKGVGYRIETWMQRTYASRDHLHLRTRKYLALIGRMQERLGLIAVGVRDNVAFTLPELQAMAASRCSDDHTRLLRTCLRFYLPADYLDRWRALAIPTIVSSGSRTSVFRSDMIQLRNRLKAADLTHAWLADKLGKCRTYITRVLNGRRPCPQGLFPK